MYLKYTFWQNNEVTRNINCRFDSFELDTMFFLKSNAYISLSMSGSLAGSISCMLAKKLHWVQAEDT